MKLVVGAPKSFLITYYCLLITIEMPKLAILAAKSHLALMWPVTSVFLDTSRKIYPTIITADRMKSPPACQSHLLLARVSQQLYITARFVRNCFHKLRTQLQGNTEQVSHRNAAKSILYAYER